MYLANAIGFDNGLAPASSTVIKKQGVSLLAG